MLVHIVYQMHAKLIKKEISWEDISIEANYNPLEEESEWFQHSELHLLATTILHQRRYPSSPTSLTEQEQIIWSIFYECSHYEWYLRPKLYQLMQSLAQYHSLYGSQPIQDDDQGR